MSEPLTLKILIILIGNFDVDCLSVVSNAIPVLTKNNAVIRLVQRPPSYGPRVESGLQSDFIRPVTCRKNKAKLLHNCLAKNYYIFCKRLMLLLNFFLPILYFLSYYRKKKNRIDSERGIFNGKMERTAFFAEVNSGIASCLIVIHPAKVLLFLKSTTFISIRTPNIC